MITTVYTSKDGKRTRHRIDLSRVDQFDEISGSAQLALVWCETHRRWEWHWVERDLLGAGSE